MNISETQQRMTRKDWNAIIIPITVMLARDQSVEWVVDKIQRQFGLHVDTVEAIVGYVININNRNHRLAGELEANP